MASELRFLHQRYAESNFDRTWQGRLFVLVRHATGFYCIFRALIVRSCIPYTVFLLMKPNLHYQSLSNILLPTPTPETLTDSPQSLDLIASTLVLLIPHPSPATEANIIYATRQMNLVLVGAVIIASIRRVLQGAARALRATPGSRNRVASLVLLVLAQLMARAFLSTHDVDGTNNACCGVTGHISSVNAHTASHFVPACGGRC